MHFSNPIDANIVRKALNEAEALYTAADCGMSYLALRDKFESNQTPNTFWFHTQGALMGSFVINWCKLFGMDVKDQYWKQTTIEQKEFREAVYRETGFNYQAWDKYRKSMSDLKAVVVDHMNPYFPLDQLPDFHPAIQILKVSHEWLRQVLAELNVAAEGPVNDSDYFKKVEGDIKATLAKF
ncbi:MAG: hypothetical protein MI867_03495 [Pseudomonadales bacterium]|nr:hypothetical protein [Pseudomonadales bacterium]